MWGSYTVLRVLFATKMLISFIGMGISIYLFLTRRKKPGRGKIAGFLFVEMYLLGGLSIFPSLPGSYHVGGTHVETGNGIALVLAMLILLVGLPFLVRGIRGTNSGDIHDEH